MKTRIAFGLVLFSVLSAGGFLFLVYGPQTLTPPPDWPFTAQSRKDYDPFGQNSQLTVKTYVNDLQAGKIK